MANSTIFFRGQLIWIYTVCKGRVYLDSAGLGLRKWLLCTLNKNISRRHPEIFFTLTQKRGHDISSKFTHLFAQSTQWGHVEKWIVCVEVLQPSQPNGVMSRSELFVLRFYGPVNPMGSCREGNCLCWGFTAQSTQWGHVEKGIVCVEVLQPSQPNGVMSRSELFVLRFYSPVNPMGSCREVNCLCWGFMAQSTQWGHVEKWIVCVEVLWPSQPNGVMSSAVSLPKQA